MRESSGAAGPERLGRYEILGEIASGGMATVFLGRVTGAKGFQRLVAIKRLHPHLESEEDFVAMFLDEARLAARIRHPNVVATLDVEDQDGLYIVMEYIEGDRLLGLLRQAAKTGERIPVPIVLRVALDILAGLHAAHELREDDGEALALVHRDVSPQNILLGIDGVCRLTDFGIAKAQSRLTVTRDGQLKGKIAYMAPEQTKKVEIDRRVDIFSMGIIVWEMLTSKKLFNGETDVEILNQLLFEPLPRLKDHAAGLPAALDAAVMRALERDPTKRYATASEFAEALERAAKIVGGAANARTVAQFVQKSSAEKLAKDRARFAGAAQAFNDVPSQPQSANSRVLRRPSSTGEHAAVGVTPPTPPAAPARRPTMIGVGVANLPPSPGPVAAPQVQTLAAGPSLVDDDEDIPTQALDRSTIAKYAPPAAAPAAAPAARPAPPPATAARPAAPPSPAATGTPNRVPPPLRPAFPASMGAMPLARSTSPGGSTAATKRDSEPAFTDDSETIIDVTDGPRLSPLPQKLSSLQPRPAIPALTPAGPPPASAPSAATLVAGSAPRVAPPGPPPHGASPLGPPQLAASASPSTMSAAAPIPLVSPPNNAVALARPAAGPPLATAVPPVATSQPVPLDIRPAKRSTSGVWIGLVVVLLGGGAGATYVLISRQQHVGAPQLADPTPATTQTPPGAMPTTGLPAVPPPLGPDPSAAVPTGVPTAVPAPPVAAVPAPPVAAVPGAPATPPAVAVVPPVLPPVVPPAAARIVPPVVANVTPPAAVVAPPVVSAPRAQAGGGNRRHVGGTAHTASPAASTTTAAASTTRTASSGSSSAATPPSGGSSSSGSGSSGSSSTPTPPRGGGDENPFDNSNPYRR